jgi:ankyrin repeat protein
VECRIFSRNASCSDVSREGNTNTALIKFTDNMCRKILLDVRAQTKQLPTLLTHNADVESQAVGSNVNPTVGPTEDQHLAIRSLPIACISPRSSQRLASFLQSLAEPVGYQIRQRYRLNLGTIDIALSSGFTQIRRWSQDGLELYATLPISEGYSVCLTFQVKQFWPCRINLLLHGLYSWDSLPRLNTYSSLRISAILPHGGQYWTAAKCGDLELLRAILGSRKHSVFDRTILGDTSLHVSYIVDNINNLLKLLQIATRYQNRDAVCFLLDNGADIDATNDIGKYVNPSPTLFRLTKICRTALHLALTQGQDLELPRLLLSRGADIYRTDIDGRTPFHTYFNDTIRIVIQSQKAEIDISAQDYQGMTIMHYISRSSRSKSVDISWCLDNTLPPKDVLGRSILHLAAQRGNIPLVKYFLKLQDAARLATSDHAGHTPLHYATESRRTDTIDFILDTGICDINAKDYRGRTVMHHAAGCGNMNAVARLITLGAGDMLHALDKDGRTPAQVAKLYGAEDCEAYMLLISQDLGFDSALARELDTLSIAKTDICHYNTFVVRTTVSTLTLDLLYWALFFYIAFVSS